MRGFLQSFSTQDIKEILGPAGLPVFKIEYQGTHKEPFLDNADRLVRDLDADSRDRFVVGCIEEIICFEDAKNQQLAKRKIQPDNQIRESLETVLARVGYGLHLKSVFPLNLQLDIEAATLPKRVSSVIAEALRRYRDGRFSGAITSICGAVDQLTEQIFIDKSLGNHKDATYQERISKSFVALEPMYLSQLQHGGIDANEAKLIWENHKKSISQAAYVIGAFRRQYSDAHGLQNAPTAFVQKTLDCAVFILRSFCGISNDAVEGMQTGSN